MCQIWLRTFFIVIRSSLAWLTFDVRIQVVPVHTLSTPVLLRGSLDRVPGHSHGGP